MPGWLAQRRRCSEWMDQPAADPDQLRQCLRFIRRVNSLLGYTRATLSHLKRFSTTWTPGERITLVDFATGSGDIPRALVHWGQSQGFDMRAVGLDRHPLTARVAAGDTSEAGRFEVVQCDVLSPPFADGSFDYALTGMFLHHLNEDQVVRVLREMNRVARRGVIVADLLRHRRAYLWIKLLTTASSPMARHDAVASVAQAFTRPEILSLGREAGLNYVTYHRHFGHRFILSGQKTAYNQVK